MKRRNHTTSAKKLTLQKERIRTLTVTPSELAQVNGGWGTYNCKSGQSCETDC